MPDEPANPPVIPPANPVNPIVSTELASAINAIVATAIDTQGRTLINSMLNTEPSIPNIVDETIEERYRGSIDQIDRIPDVVRYLKDFSGNPSEFSSWKKSVERILDIYSSERGRPRYFGILNVIRNKIVGNADVVLESYNTPLNWEAISKCLTLHYADKRDIRTLEYQLMALVQNNTSIDEFYQKIYTHLSLILNKISCMNIDNTSITLLTKTYRDKALDTFIRGLNGDLPRLLAMREPESLPQALHLCSKLANQEQRNVYTNNALRQNVRPPLPPRTLPYNQYQQQQVRQYQPQQTQHYQQQQQQMSQYQQPRTPRYQQQQPFYPQLAYLPQYPRQQLQQNPAANNNRFQRAPPQQSTYQQNLGEPMDIDSSIHTQRINYMNRPQNNKRPASSIAEQQKRQRNFNINTEFNHDIEETEEPCNVQQEENYSDLFTQDFSDVHFLG